jgi:hypothetical protein
VGEEKNEELRVDGHWYIGVLVIGVLGRRVRGGEGERIGSRTPNSELCTLHTELSIDSPSVPEP